MFFSSFSSATSEISRKQQWLLKIDIVPVPVYPPKAKPCDVSIPHEAWKICIPRPPTQAILVINPKPSLTPSQDLHATLSTRTVSGAPGPIRSPFPAFCRDSSPPERICSSRPGRIRLSSGVLEGFGETKKHR